MAFSGAFVKPFRPAFDAGLAAAAVPWYLAGGAPAPIAVYEPKGKASLAASYLRIAGSAGNANLDPSVVGSGIAPSFNTATGWTGNASGWLATGLTPAADQSWSVLVRFSAMTNNSYLILLGNGTSAAHLFLAPWWTTGIIYTHGTQRYDVGARMDSGVMAIAGRSVYRNGVSDGADLGSGAVNTTAISLLTATGSLGNRIQGSLQAAAFWDTSTNHATWMPAVMAACALI